MSMPFSISCKSPLRVGPHRGTPGNGTLFTGIPASTSRSSRRVHVNAAAEIEALKGLEIMDVDTGAPIEVTSLVNGSNGKMCLLAFFTHFADLGSFEYAQKLTKMLSKFEKAGVAVVAVGLGSVSGGQEFSKFTNFPVSNLYADPAGACYEALGYEKGFAPNLEISPYLKLLPMLMGINSPGTIQEVLRGYVGDSSSEPVFDSSSPFNILGTGYQRPFELATLRLFNSGKILANWEALCPPNTDLLTQQGGTLLLKGGDVIYKHRDSGILITADVEKILDVVERESGN